MARFGTYDIVRPLSSGGMSDAFLARSPQGRLVVLKKPKSYDPELLARLRDEGRLGSKLFHPHLVETLDSFEFQGQPILVLGYVEGPMVDTMRRIAALPPAAVARIGCHVAEALAALHATLGDDGTPLRAVHRDVSARNVIVTPQGEAVLIDLGIARTDDARDAQTQTGMVLGTLRYMAPELIDGGPATPAADIYSLGCVLIEAATGQTAFSGPPSEVAAAIVAKGPLASPAAERMHPRLREVLARMVARQPAERFQEAHEASAALRAVEAALGGGASDLGDRAVHAMSQPAPAESGMMAPAPVPLGPTGPAPLSVPAGIPTGVPAGVSAGAPAGAPAGMPAPAAVSVPAPAFSGLSPEERSTVNRAVASDWYASSPFGAPASARSAPSPAGVAASRPQPTPELFRPPPQAAASLELAVEPRRRQPIVEGPQDPREWYPKTKSDHRWLVEGAKKVLLVVVLVGGGLGGWRWYTARENAREKAALDLKLQQETELLRKALADTPECRLSGAAMWVYEDKRGTATVVDSIEKVPKQYKKSARCVLPAR